MSRLRDEWEEAVELLIEEHGDGSELKDLLSEKLRDTMEGGHFSVDDAIFEATNSPSDEDELYDMRRDILDEAVSRVCENYVIITHKELKRLRESDERLIKISQV